VLAGELPATVVVQCEGVLFTGYVFHVMLSLDEVSEVVTTLVI
jgi:hypothetical protein